MSSISRGVNSKAGIAGWPTVIPSARVSDKLSNGHLLARSSSNGAETKGLSVAVCVPWHREQSSSTNAFPSAASPGNSSAAAASRISIIAAPSKEINKQARIKITLYPLTAANRLMSDGQATFRGERFRPLEREEITCPSNIRGSAWALADNANVEKILTKSDRRELI